MKLILLIFFISIPILSHDYFIYERTNTPIYFSVSEYTFPNSWQTRSISPKGESLKKEEQRRSKNVLIKALDKYPASVIKKNLKAIYVLGHLEFYGQLFGGTNSNDIVYLTNKGITKGYTDFYLEQTFHHEFSSIFLRNFPKLFNKTKWKDLNAKGFKYGKGGVKALKEGKTGQVFYKEVNKKGLLTEYSKSSLENDLNTFAQNIFLPNKNFAQVLKKHKKLRKKREFLINFYNKIDKRFTKKFFDNIMWPKKKLKTKKSIK